MKYCIGGVAFSGNKGASGMLTALMQNIRRYDPEARFAVLSYYPRSDREGPHRDDAEIWDGSPKAVVGNFFRSGLYKLHLPGAGVLRRIAECDFFLDAAGISFADGREKFTCFNILTFLPALAAGVPVVKVSQALGPFDGRLNRFLARRFLPRMKLIAARGAQTEKFLAELGLHNVERFPDAAFSLECSDADDRAAAALLPPGLTPGRIIGISPSQVVYSLCRGKHVDYLGELAELVRDLAGRGFDCVLFPHSARENTEKTHNNDLPLLRRFAAMLSGTPRLTVIDRELDAGVLRRLIARCDLLVASRFHAIISAMATGVPAVVVGWSHKYAEALAPFELERFVQPYAEFSAARTLEMVDGILADRDELSRKIADRAAVLREENQRFFTRFSTN